MRRTTGSRLLTLIPAAAIGAGALVALAPGASAAGTAATFTLSAGSLNISQPASTSFGSFAVGTTSISGPLGDVTVTDGRGLLTATWTASVSATNFVTGGATQYETVANSSITYSSGTATTTGVGTFAPGVGLTLGSQQTAGQFAGTGNNTATWNPTVTFALSPSQVAGQYNGTITHSVA